MTTRRKSVSKVRQDRMPMDSYETPINLCRAVCAWLKDHGVNPQHILEPSAAQGNFVIAAREAWPTAEIVAVEISRKLVEREAMRTYLLDLAKWKRAREERGGITKNLWEDSHPPPTVPQAALDTVQVLRTAGANLVFIDDFLTAESFGAFDLILGNPPYTAGGGAQAHTRKALTLLNPGGVLSFVLKMHFRGTADRIPFWKEHKFASDPPIVPRPDFTGDGRDTVEYTLYNWQRAWGPVLPELRFGAHRPTVQIHCADAIEWTP